MMTENQKEDCGSQPRDKPIPHRYRLLQLFTWFGFIIGALFGILVGLIFHALLSSGGILGNPGPPPTTSFVCFLYACTILTGAFTGAITFALVTLFLTETWRILRGQSSVSSKYAVAIILFVLFAAIVMVMMK